MFQDKLSPYGTWVDHPRWGRAWRPNSQAGFRPYTNGHWEDSADTGTTWVSNDPWGGDPTHYGRWGYDPRYGGWLWVPGYTWGPGWVEWRQADDYVGWFPMPPDDDFIAGREVYRTDWDWNRGYGYQDWYGPEYGENWLMANAVFVDERHFADRNFNRYVAPRNRIAQIINNTQNVTNYATENNHVVNRSIDVREIERARGRPVAPEVAARVTAN